MYARLMQGGQTVVIRRKTGAGSNPPTFDVPVRGRHSGFDPASLVGGIVQGDSQVIILAEDLAGVGFALPFRVTYDAVIIDGQSYSIKAPVPRRASDGTIVAYELQVTGGGK